MKIFVTGCAGFIGSNLVEELLKNNYEVVGIDNFITGRKENIEGLEFEFIQGDIGDKILLRKILKDVDYVLHQAALPSVTRSIEDPLSANQHNINATLTLLKCCVEENVEKVVIASSSSVYGDSKELPKHESMSYNPKSPYAVTKVAVELYAKVFYEVYDLKTICLRYFNVYGPKQDPKSEYAAVIPKFIYLALKNKPLPIYGDGKQTRDFTFIKDAVRANLLAMQSKATGNYNIAFGKRTSILELAEKIISLTSSNSKIVFEKPRKGDIRHSLASIEKAKRDLGYNPEYDLEKGLKKTIEWFREKTYSKAG